jgi:hypothetical protein
LLHAARARVAVQTAIELGPVELDGLKIWPRPVDDAEFARLAGGERADALVRIENGKPEIIARRGAPAAAIREEVIHLYQYQTDIAMRVRMDGLSKEHLARWDSLSPGEKLGLHIDKLEVEADAQRRIIDHLSTRAADDPEIATRVLDAEETLYLLGQRIEGLRAAQGLPRIDLRQLGIERAPQLFSRGAHTPTRVTGPKADAVRAFVGRTPRPKITDAGADQELSTLGYRVDRSKATGTYFRISRPPKHANDLPHLSIEDDGTIVEGKVGSSFTERRDDAAREWNSVAEKESEIARKVAAGELNAEHAATQWADAQRVMAAEWRSALQRLIDAGTIDTGSAGLYLRWGPCIEELVRRSEAPRLNLKHFVDRLRPGKAGRAADDEFREVVRREIIDQLKTIEDPARRSDKLHEWLDLQPSEGAKGELFSQYQRTAMDAHTDEVGNNVYRTGDRPGTITAAGQVKARTPDGVIEVLPNVENELPRGNYLLENKTGPGAFKLKQIEDLTRASDPATGFRRSATSADRWDGVVVVFSRRSEAATAARALQSSPLTGPLVGRGRVGIHVMALDRDGVFRLVTPKPGAVGP